MTAQQSPWQTGAGVSPGLATMLIGGLGALLYIFGKFKEDDMRTEDLLAVMAASIMGGPAAPKTSADAVAMARAILAEVDAGDVAGLVKERAAVRQGIEKAQVELGRMAEAAETIGGVARDAANPPPPAQRGFGLGGLFGGMPYQGGGIAPAQAGEGQGGPVTPPAGTGTGTGFGVPTAGQGGPAQSGL